MEYLPDLVFEEIFDYLDEQDLRSVGAVCRRWSYVIKSTSKLMNRFNFKITINNKKTQRMFNFSNYEVISNLTIEMTLKDPLKISENVMNEIAAHGDRVQILSLKGLKESQVLDVLKIMPNLRKLTLIHCGYGNLRESLELPHLQHLELVNSFSYVKFINGHSLKILKVLGGRSVNKNTIFYMKMMKKLRNYIAECPHLEELMISNIKYGILKFENLNLKLKTITIESTRFVDEKLAIFLQNQHRSLKNLAISCKSLGLSMLKCIFSDLNLDTLELDVMTFPDNFRMTKVKLPIKNLVLGKLQDSSCSFQIDSEENETKRNNNLLRQTVPHVRNKIRGYSANRSRSGNGNSLDSSSDESDDEANTLRQAIPGVYQHPVLYQRRPHLVRNNLFRQRQRIESNFTPTMTEQIISLCSSAEKVTILNPNLVYLIQQINASMANLKVLKLIKMPQCISPTIQLDDFDLIEVQEIFSIEDLDNLMFLIRYTTNLKFLKFSLRFRAESCENLLAKVAIMSKNVKRILIEQSNENSWKQIISVNSITNNGKNLKLFNLDKDIFSNITSQIIIGDFILEPEISFRSNRASSICSITKECKIDSMWREHSVKSLNTFF